MDHKEKAKLQQNVINDIHGSQKKRKIGNSSYPEWLITKEQLPTRKETRIGEMVAMKRKCIINTTDTAIKKLQVISTTTQHVAPEFKSIGSAFGNIFTAHIRKLKVPDGHNYQNYLLSDTYFQGYYSLSLNTNSEQWFSNFKEERNKLEINKMCSLFSIKLFHLFEESLMEHNKTRISYQLKVLNFFQNDGVKQLVSDINGELNNDIQCLSILFMFLSNQLVDNWLPCLIKSHKDTLDIGVKSPAKSNYINPLFDDEVNRLIGWPLFAEINKYRKMMKNKRVFNLSTKRKY